MEKNINCIVSAKLFILEKGLPGMLFHNVGGRPEQYILHTFDYYITTIYMAEQQVFRN